MLFISAGTCRGRTNVRLCGRHWRMILSIVTRGVSGQPRDHGGARTLTKSSSDDSRYDAAAVSLLSMSIVGGAHCAASHLSVDCDTRVASYPAIRWRTGRNRAFFARVRLTPRPPAFIKRPPPSPPPPHFYPLDGTTGKSRRQLTTPGKRFCTNFGKRVGKGLLQAYRKEAQSRQMSGSRRID